MVLTKFIVHSASHQANKIHVLSLTQNGGNLVHEMIFNMEPTEKILSNFLKTLWKWIPPITSQSLIL